MYRKIIKTFFPLLFVVCFFSISVIYIKADEMSHNLLDFNTVSGESIDAIYLDLSLIHI